MQYQEARNRLTFYNRYMAETLPKRTPEQFWRWARNVSLLGTVGLAAAGIILPQYQAALNTGAAYNLLQAGGAEWLRRRRAKKTA